MSSINLHTEEISIKVVYYGPGLGGKTTSLQFMHRALRPDNRGQLISLATGIDRTLYFDFLPVKLPKLKGFAIRMSLYTVPGQVHYNATRKLVLQGADGVVFVADSQPGRADANIESMENLAENLRGHGMNPDTVPLVIQYNKRDLPGVLSVGEMEADLNHRGVPAFETCAVTGKGIFDSLKTITKLVLADLKRKGIYQDQETAQEPSREDSASGIKIAEYETPQTKETSGLAQAIVTHLDSQPPAAAAATSQPPVVAGDARFEELWESAAGRDRIGAVAEEIAAGRYADAVRSAEDALEDHLADASGTLGGAAETLLSLGVAGPHWNRFQEAVAKTEPSRIDALFCLFFLTDVELRMQATRTRIVE
jgi:signal recognition particle receptor subunit beta